MGFVSGLFGVLGGAQRGASAGAASADSGSKPNPPCGTSIDGKTLHAVGLNAADHVAAPRAAGDPIVVRDYADQRRYHLIDR